MTFNNAYCRVLNLPWRSSASAMYANFGIQNLSAIIRKSTFGFIQRLAKSTNSFIMAIENSWIVHIDICVASLQKGPHVAIYQSRENRS